MNGKRRNAKGGIRTIAPSTPEAVSRRGRRARKGIRRNPRGLHVPAPSGS